jgi:hypothetical protein
MTAGLSQKWHSSRLGMPFLDREIHPVAVALILVIDAWVNLMFGLWVSPLTPFVGSIIYPLVCRLARMPRHSRDLNRLGCGRLF